MKGRYGYLMCIAVSVSTAAEGASFNCAKASTDVEKAICSAPDLSKRDDRLSEVFKAALRNDPEGADDLRQEQRRWLRTRDGKDASELTRLYDERISELTIRYAAGDSQPLNVILKHAQSLRSADGDLVEALVRQGAPIELIETTWPKSAKAFGLEPGESLRQQFELGGRVGDRRAAREGVGSAFTVGGTALCWEEFPYKVDGHRAVSIDLPGAWDGPDCMASHHLARVDGRLAAISLTPGQATDVVLSLSPWTGATFGSTQTVRMAFAPELSVAVAICGPAGTPCDDFGQLALEAASRYQLTPATGALGNMSEAPNDIAYREASQALKTHGDPGRAIPSFGKTVEAYGADTYGTDATTFPMTFQGETLLGLIGNPHLGWKTSSDWVVSAWRLSDGQLKPVASARISVRRGVLLQSKLQ